MRDLSLLGFTANVQLVVTHVISIAICAQFKWPLPSQLAAMATPRPFDHFSSIGKLLEAREAKARAQADTAKRLVMAEAADVLRRKRELAQQKADLSAYAQDLMPYKRPEI